MCILGPTPESSRLAGIASWLAGVFFWLAGDLFLAGWSFFLAVWRFFLGGWSLFLADWSLPWLAGFFFLAGWSLFLAGWSLFLAGWSFLLAGWSFFFWLAVVSSCLLDSLHGWPEALCLAAAQSSPKHRTEPSQSLGLSEPLSAFLGFLGHASQPAGSPAILAFT